MNQLKINAPPTDEASSCGADPSADLNSQAAASALTSPSKWEADIHLVLAQRERGTRLTKNQHSGPLYVQKPFYPEGRDIAHVYLLHPPGGLVSGDKLKILAELEADSRAVFTTPGAGRVYKARQDQTLQQQDIYFQLGAAAQLEWLPMETIVFPGANTRLTTRIDIQPDSLFCGWDITCLGLQANQQRFDQGSVQQRFEIYEQGKLQLLETFVAEGSNDLLMHGPASLRGCSVNGFFVVGPLSSDSLAVGADGNDAGDSKVSVLIESLRASLGFQIENAERPYLFAVTQVKHYLVMRYLGCDSHQARKIFLAAWQRLRPVLFKRIACEPRIWAT